MCNVVSLEIAPVLGRLTACHISGEANRLGAHQFVLPRLFIHNVWVSASAISCNLMITESYWCKALVAALNASHFLWRYWDVNCNFMAGGSI